MKPLVAVQVGSAARAALGCVLVTLIGSAALAQTTGVAAPKPDADAASAKQQPPPGGCMPIGVTVSGQIVFAFQCKDFIEQQKAANQNPAAGEDKPATAAETPAADAGETCARGREASRGGREDGRKATGWRCAGERQACGSTGSSRCQSTPSATSARAAARTFAPTMRHPAPTCPLMDSAIRAARSASQLTRR